ncbi:MAG: tetratricopeptide repeat protein [Verrucomicrobiaceae bacterium]|nr:tetratricopeptide repeat protein [Verrucomicrobiaceae bacterium]
MAEDPPSSFIVGTVGGTLWDVVKNVLGSYGFEVTESLRPAFVEMLTAGQSPPNHHLRRANHRALCRALATVGTNLARRDGLQTGLWRSLIQHWQTHRTLQGWKARARFEREKGSGAWLGDLLRIVEAEPFQQWHDQHLYGTASLEDLFIARPDHPRAIPFQAEFLHWLQHDSRLTAQHQPLGDHNQPQEFASIIQHQTEGLWVLTGLEFQEQLKKDTTFFRSACLWMLVHRPGSHPQPEALAEQAAHDCLRFYKESLPQLLQPVQQAIESWSLRILHAITEVGSGVSNIQAELASLHGEVVVLKQQNQILIQQNQFILQFLERAIGTQVFFQVSTQTAVQVVIQQSAQQSGLPEERVQAHLQEAVQAVQQNPEADPLDLAAAATLAGDYPNAAEYAGDATFQEGLRPESQQRSWYLIRAALLEANALLQAQKMEEAAAALQETAARISAEHQPLLRAHVLQHAGKLLTDAGHYREAETALQESLLLYHDHLGPLTQPTTEAAYLLGGLYWHEGRYHEAEINLRQALSFTEQREGDSHSTARCLTGLAFVQQDQGLLEEAESFFRRALEVSEQVHPPGHQNISAACGNLGSVLLKQGHPQEAEPLLRRSLEILKQAPPASHSDIGISFGNLGTLLQAQGRLDEAEPLLRRALEIVEQALPAGHPHIATAWGNLGRVLQAQGRMEKAEPLLRRALEIYEQALHAGHPDIATACGNLGGVLQDQGRLEEAEPMLRRALEIFEESLPASHPDIATACGKLGSVLQDQGRLEEAEELRCRALALTFEWEATNSTQSPHRSLRVTKYLALLTEMEVPEQERRDRLEVLARETGFEARAVEELLAEFFQADS